MAAVDKAARRAELDDRPAAGGYERVERGPESSVAESEVMAVLIDTAAGRQEARDLRVLFADELPSHGPQYSATPGHAVHERSLRVEFGR